MSGYIAEIHRSDSMKSLHWKHAHVIGPLKILNTWKSCILVQISPLFLGLGWSLSDGVTAKMLTSQTSCFIALIPTTGLKLENRSLHSHTFLWFRNLREIFKKCPLQLKSSLRKHSEKSFYMEFPFLCCLCSFSFFWAAECSVVCGLWWGSPRLIASCCPLPPLPPPLTP